MRQSHKTILLWLLLILMFVSIYQLFTGSTKPGEEKIAFGTFMQEVENNPQRIAKVTIKGDHWTGEYNDAQHTRFRTIGPAAPETLAKLDKAGNGKTPVKYEIEEQDQNTIWQVLLGSWLPMVALVLIFFLFMRQLQAARFAAPIYDHPASGTSRRCRMGS